MLTSVAGVGASLARVPSDLASLLGFPGMAPRTVSEVEKGLYGAGLSAAVHVPMRSSSAVRWPQLLVTSAHWGASSTGNVAGHPTLGGVATTGVSEELSVSEVAPVVPEAVAPSGVLSSLKHTISAVLVPASLAALAACVFAGHRRAPDHQRSRDGGRIPPSQSGLDTTSSGDRSLCPSRAVGCCPIGFPGCRASPCIARPRSAFRGGETPRVGRLSNAARRTATRWTARAHGLDGLTIQSCVGVDARTTWNAVVLY